MRYTIEQRIFMYEEYIKHKSFVECCVAFIQKYPGVKIPRKSVVRKLVTKFRKTGSLLDETEEVDKRQRKCLPQNKLQTHKTSSHVSKQSRSHGPITRAVTRNNYGSDMEHAVSHKEGQQEADPFAFVGIKCEVADDTDDLGSDSGSNMQKPSAESRMLCVKEEPLDTSSCESSDESEGDSESDSDVKQHYDESQLICVKEEPPDATGSDSSLDEAGQERMTQVTLKQEVPDDSFVSGVRSDSGVTEQVPTRTSSHLVLESRLQQQQVVFTSSEVKCESENCRIQE